MFAWVKKVWKKFVKAYTAFSSDDVPGFASISPQISRDGLKRKCRILFVDDEVVDLIDDLRREGFSVDHDMRGDDISNIEKGCFDLVVLDYRGVGKKYGNNDGLSLLKAIRRVNPAIFVLAYTSANLPPAVSADFYKSVDGTLGKDEGVADSIIRIEEALRASLDPARLWGGVLASLAITPGSKAAYELEQRVMKALHAGDREKARLALGQSVGAVDSTVMSALVEKLVDVAVGAVLAV
jgi:DNA-binding NarL/FixJ family response regulator